MATPEARRAEILDVATRLFAARGFEGVSLKEIAQESGMRAPSLLHHFESKEALHGAVLARIFEHWQQVMPRLLKAATHGSGTSAEVGERRFEGLVQEVARFFMEDADRGLLLLREMLDRPAQMRGLMVEYMTPWLTILDGYLERGRRDGVIREGVDARAYVTLVMQLLVASLAYEQVIGALVGEKSMERLVSEAMRLARVALFQV